MFLGGGVTEIAAFLLELDETVDLVCLAGHASRGFSAEFVAMNVPVWMANSALSLRAPNSSSRIASEALYADGAFADILSGLEALDSNEVR